MGGGMGYLAWEKLVNDKPVVRAAADLLVGEEAVDKGLEMAGNATNKIADAADKAGESLQEVANRCHRWVRLGVVWVLFCGT